MSISNVVWKVQNLNFKFWEHEKNIWASKQSLIKKVVNYKVVDSIESYNFGDISDRLKNSKICISKFDSLKQIFGPVNDLKYKVVNYKVLDPIEGYNFSLLYCFFVTFLLPPFGLCVGQQASLWLLLMIIFFDSLQDYLLMTWL